MASSPNVNMSVLDVNVGTSETTVAHELGRIALEAFVVVRDVATDVYRGSTAWDITNIYIQAGASVDIRIVII